MNTFDELDLSSPDLDFLGGFQGSDDDGDEDTLLAQSTKDSREQVRKIWYRSVSICLPASSMEPGRAYSFWRLPRLVSRSTGTRYRDATSACIPTGLALGLAQNVQLNILSD